MDQTSRLIAALERRAVEAPTLAEAQRLHFEADRLRHGGRRPGRGTHARGIPFPRN